MTSPILPRIRTAILLGSRRFPLLTVAGLIGFVAMLLLNHSESEEIQNQCRDIGLAVVFAFPLIIAAGYTGALFPSRSLLAHIIAIGCVLAHWHFLDYEITPLVLLWVASTALASVIPGIIREPQSNWWRINIGTLNALFLTFCLTSVLCMGLYLALESINALFGLKISRFSADIPSFCGFLIAPLALSILLPAARAPLDAELPGYALWGRFCQWALVPLGFLFTGILTIYGIRILLQWELPDGIVALPVICLGCYGLTAQLMLEPWREEKVWAKGFTRLFPAVFPIFSVLLFVALFQRIGEYGFTSERYLALAIAVWITVSSLLLLVRRTANPAFVPALLALAAIISAIGPLNLRTVCLKSQSTELLSLLSQRSPDNEARIASVLQYIALNYDRATVERIIGPLGLKGEAAKGEVLRAAQKKLRLVAAFECDAGVEFKWPTTQPVSINGYRRIYGPVDRKITIAGSDSSDDLHIEQMESGLRVYQGQKTLHTFDLSSIDPDSAEQAPAPPNFTWNVGDTRFQVVILEAQWRMKKGCVDCPKILSSVQFLILEQ